MPSSIQSDATDLSAASIGVLPDVVTFPQAMEWLRRHRSRRIEGIPTVSTLVGPDALTTRCLRQFAAESQTHRQGLVITSADSWFHDWTAELFNSDPFWQAVNDWIYQKLDREVRSTPLPSSQFDRDRLLRSVGIDEDSAGTDGLAARLWNSIGDSLFRGGAKCGTGGCDLDINVFRSIIQNSAQNDFERFADLIALVPDNVVATLVFRIDRNRAPRTLSTAARLVTASPRCGVAVIATPSAWAEAMSATPDCYDKAVMSENAIRLVGLSANEVADRICRRWADEHPADSFPMERKAKSIASELFRTVESVSEEMAGRLAEACCCKDRAKPREASPPRSVDDSSSCHESSKSHIDRSSDNAPFDVFRSAQEQFLFELLEGHPETAGIFRPNCKPGFSFGGRLAEIDLCAQGPKIAIEIDGYYHFADQDAYRRDRRKDLQLQQHGFLVLRFLADDVVPDMGGILKTIQTAVRSRRGGLMGQSKHENEQRQE